MMTVFTLSEYLATANRPMDWLVSPPSFVDKVLKAFADGYGRADELEHGLSPLTVGNDRYGGSNSALIRAFKSIGAVPLNVNNQQRVVINDPRGVQYQLAVRHGHKVEKGFDTNRCGQVIEQFSMLELESLVNENGDPFTMGALFIHREVPLAPGYVEVWFVPEWRCRKGKTLIEAPISIYLGSARFRSEPPSEVEPEGETFEL